MLLACIALSAFCQQNAPTRLLPSVERLAYKTQAEIEKVLGAGSPGVMADGRPKTFGDADKGVQWRLSKPQNASLEVWFHKGLAHWMQIRREAQLGVTAGQMLDLFGLYRKEPWVRSFRGVITSFTYSDAARRDPIRKLEVGLIDAKGESFERAKASTCTISIQFELPKVAFDPTKDGSAEERSFVLHARSEILANHPSVFGLEVRDSTVIHHRLYGPDSAGTYVDLIWTATTEESAKRAVLGDEVPSEDLLGYARVLVAAARLGGNSAVERVGVEKPISILSQLWDGSSLTFNGEQMNQGYVPRSPTAPLAESSWSCKLAKNAMFIPESGSSPDVCGFWKSAGNTSLQKGEVLHLKCAGNPQYSYSLYVPKHHSSSYPVMVNMSPRGHGRPLSIAIAEKLGVAMIGLTEAKDGPWNVVCQNQAAALIDINSRIPIDWSRLYFSGQSGGARAAVAAAYRYAGMIKGVVCVGAASMSGAVINGKWAGLGISKSLPMAFIAGSADYNLDEVQARAQTEKALGRSVWFETFKGPHSWGPQSLLDRAALWVISQPSK